MKRLLWSSVLVVSLSLAVLTAILVVFARAFLKLEPPAHRSAEPSPPIRCGR